MVMSVDFDPISGSDVFSACKMSAVNKLWMREAHQNKLPSWQSFENWRFTTEYLLGLWQVPGLIESTVKLTLEI